MQRLGMIFIVLLAALAVSPSAAAKASAAAKGSPIEKVIGMIDDLITKTEDEGTAQDKAYKEYVEWCDDSTSEKAHEIKGLKAEKGKLVSTINKAKSDIEDADTEIESLSKKIAEDEKSLKKATEIRKKENADFVEAEKELVEAVEMLGKAIDTLEKGSSASFIQKSDDLDKILGGLTVVINAAGVDDKDKQKLMALLESQQDAEDASDEMGAPAPDAYENKSGGIVEVLEDMKDKAESELDEARKAESKAQHAFNMAKQGLEQALAAANMDLDENKSLKANAAETQATAEGDLSVTDKTLAEGASVLKETQDGCMTAAADHEDAGKARAEELKVLAEVKKVIVEATSKFVQVPASFLQVSAQAQMGSTGKKIVSLMRKLAQKQHSSALAQLASRISAVVRYGKASNSDPFAKIKEMLEGMLAKLAKEAEEEAGEKQFCDAEMSKTEEKKAELEEDIEKLTAKIDKAASASGLLKEEVTQLNGELAVLVKAQSEADKVRKEENAIYLKSKADLEAGLAGLRSALDVLRDYYGGASALIQENDNDASFDSFMQQPSPPAGHEKSSGAGGGIIAMIETCESDMAKELSAIEAEESDAQEEYDKLTQENNMIKATKQQDIKYKTAEAKGLDKAIAEFQGDKDTASSELDAVLEYYAKVKDRCVAKPDTYEERKKRRDAEIAGLKEGLDVLENAAFVQRPSIRGAKRHFSD